MVLKERISSPLEAGPSILDAHYLPPQLTPALEYVSNRLAKKSIHVTLVVARRDYQLPKLTTPRAPTTPGLSSPGFSAPTTPLSPRFNFPSNPVSVLKQLVRSSSSSSSKPASIRTGMISPPLGIDLPSPSPSLRVRWPMTPTTPLSPPPMTPSASSTYTTDSMNSTMSDSSFGMRLIHASMLPEKREKVLRTTLERAEKRFQVGTEWLAPSVSPSECGLTNQLINTSIVQNEVLFSGEGLTLLSLDRLYCLKSALSSYCKSKSYLRLEDAVDELRRTILANNGEKVPKADLLRSYDWLNVSNSALNDLDRMYRRAYGGPDQRGGIQGMPHFAEPVIREQSAFEEESENAGEGENQQEQEEVQIQMVQEIGLAISSRQTDTTPTPPTKAAVQPLLKLQTSFDSKPKAPVPKSGGEEDDEDDDTARPTERNPYAVCAWQGISTIDQVLSPFSPDVLTPLARESQRLSQRLGPMTPNGHDDLSPATQGEWGFLMFKGGFKGRTVAIENW